MKCTNLRVRSAVAGRKEEDGARGARIKSTRPGKQREIACREHVPELIRTQGNAFFVFRLLKKDFYLARSVPLAEGA